MGFGDDILNPAPGQTIGSSVLNQNLKRINKKGKPKKIGYPGSTGTELPSATLARQKFGGAVPEVEGEKPISATPQYRNYVEKPPWQNLKIYDANDQFSTLKEMYRYHNLGTAVHPGLALGVLFSPALNRESISFLFRGENFRNKLKELSEKYQPENILQATQVLKDPTGFLGSYIGRKMVDIPVVKDVLVKAGAKFALRVSKLPAQFMLEQAETSDNIKIGMWTTPWKYPWGKSKEQIKGENFWREKAKNYINAVNKVAASEELRPENERAGAVGSAIFSMAAAVITTLATKSPAAAFALFGGMAKGAGYEQARAKGIDPSKASAFSTAQGLAEGGLEYWGLHKLLAPSTGLVGVAKKALTEAIQESSQEVAGAAIGTAGGYEDRKWSLDSIGKDVVLSAAIGAVMGGGVGVTVDLATEQKIIKEIQQGYNVPKPVAAGMYKTYVKMQNMLASEAGFADFSKKKTSQLSKKTEERATAEEVLDKPLEDLTEYETKEMQAGITKAREFAAKNTDKAIKIALGQEQSPEGIFSGRIYKAVEKHAKDTKDIDLIKKLASSPLAKQFSEKGQEIQALYDPEQDYWTSPVEIVKDVQKKLEEGVKTKAWRPGRVEVGRVAKEIETKLKSTPAKVNADEIVDKLAKKVETQVKPAKSLTDKKLEQKKVNELVNELFKIAKQTLPAKGKKTPKPALKQVQEMFAKNEKALKTYESAKELVKKKFAKNPEILEALTEYEKTIPKTPVSKATVTKVVREELKKNNVKLRNVIKTSIKEQKTTVEGITASLIKTGFSEKSANVFASLARTELQSQVAKTKTSALKQITTAMGKKIPQTTLFEKIEKLNKLGALEDIDYQDLARAKLGIDVSTEELNALVDLTTQVSETKDAIDRNSVDGSESRLAYGRSFRALQNYVAALKNPRLKMGLLQMAKDVSLAEVVMRPLQATKTVAGLAKAMKATWDNSFVGRQGRKLMLAEPKLWYKQTRKSFSNIVRTFGGAEVLDEFYAGVYSRENYLNGIYKAMGLDIGVTEEDIPVVVHEKLPGAGRVFKAADAAFTVFAQGSRADTADKFYKIAQEMGEETSPKWFKDTGKLIGALTSRSKLGRWEPVADTVNVFLFAPRNLRANIDFLTMPFDPRLTPSVRNRQARNLLKYILGIAIILGTARALGAKIELDSRSADFGTIRIGSTRFDVSGGIKPIVVLGSRLLHWMASYANEDIAYFKSSSTGKMTTRKESTILSTTGQKMVIDFFQNKLSPGYGLANTLAKGKDYDNETPTLEKEIKNLFVPLISQVPGETASQADSAPVIAAVLAEFFGESAQTYTSPDNPLIKEDKEWEADMSAKDKNGDFLLTNKEKFNARFQWRKEISPYLDKLAKQKNKKAGRGWAEFRKIWNERNTDLESEYISPDSDNFNQEVWDKELNKVLRKHPAFANQWDNIPQKLILR